MTCRTEDEVNDDKETSIGLLLTRQPRGSRFSKAPLSVLMREEKISLRQTISWYISTHLRSVHASSNSEGFISWQMWPSLINRKVTKLSLRCPSTTITTESILFLLLPLFPIILFPSTSSPIYTQLSLFPTLINDPICPATAIRYTHDNTLHCAATGIENTNGN